MTLTIAQESPLTEDATRLLNGSEAALREVYEMTECSSYNAAQLDVGSVRFLVARLDGHPVGCVALRTEDGYSEIKRLYTDPAVRGQGMAKALVADLETSARAEGCSRILLETGSKLKADVSLYDAIGYTRRGSYGDYQQGDMTVFMEKVL